MREHNGQVINQQLVKEMVAYWNEHKHEMGGTYEDFICLNTGWTHEEFVQWSANGRLPK